MGTESIEASFLSIFALISFFIFLIISKFSYKIGKGVLLDKDFNKPQAFHDLPVTRSGGLAIIISLSIFFGIYYLLYSKILFDYILICYSMFLVGFLDDLKIKIKPLRRLLMMILLLFVLIYLLPIQILNIDISLLSFISNNHFFSSVFVRLNDKLFKAKFLFNCNVDSSTYILRSASLRFSSLSLSNTVISFPPADWRVSPAFGACSQ